MKRLSIHSGSAGDKATGLNMQSVAISQAEKDAAETVVRRALATEPEFVDEVLSALGLAS